MTSTSYVTRGSAFERDMDYLPDRVTALARCSRDPHEEQPLEVPTWAVEPGRYRLVAAKAPGRRGRSSSVSCSGWST